MCIYTVQKFILCLIFFVELENRCIMAALPYVLGEKSTHKHTSGEHFFEVVLVSELCIFINFIASIGRNYGVMYIFVLHCNYRRSTIFR